MWVGVDAEFVVAAANVLDECLPGADRLGGTDAFQSTHRPQAGLELAVVGFDPVVRPPGIDVTGVRQQFVEHPGVGGRLVGGHFDRPAAVRQRGGEEPAGRGQVPVLGGEDVDDLAVLVDRPVQVDPPAGDLHIRLVREPAIPGRVPAGPSRVDQQRGEPLDPAVDGHMVDDQAAFGEELLNTRYDRA